MNVECCELSDFLGLNLQELLQVQGQVASKECRHLSIAPTVCKLHKKSINSCIPQVCSQEVEKYRCRKRLAYLWRIWLKCFWEAIGRQREPPDVILMTSITLSQNVTSHQSGTLLHSDTIYHNNHGAVFNTMFQPPLTLS